MTASPPSNADNGSQPSTGTSRSLLERVKANDPGAWERLVGLYAPLVYYWCQRSDLQEADSADIFQEVFQAVAAHIERFHKDRSGDTFRGWLHTITRNKIHDHFRKWKKQPEGAGGSTAQLRWANHPAPIQPEATSSSSQSAEQSLFFRALDLIRSEFAERTWQAFWKTTVENQSPSDVGNELSMTPGAVRVAKSRVLHRLRRELGDVQD